MRGQPHAPAASTPAKDPVPIVQEAGWAPGPVWTGGKSRPHRDSILDRPARSQSLYRLSYRGPQSAIVTAHYPSYAYYIRPSWTYISYSFLFPGKRELPFEVANYSGRVIQTVSESSKPLQHCRIRFFGVHVCRRHSKTGTQTRRLWVSSFETSRGEGIPVFVNRVCLSDDARFALS